MANGDVRSWPKAELPNVCCYVAIRGKQTLRGQIIRLPSGLADVGSCQSGQSDLLHEWYGGSVAAQLAVMVRGGALATLRDGQRTRVRQQSLAVAIRADSLVGISTR
jgi:predicted ABC-type transport system involved in lysophospholipase L1 biosynthesis ATPase subunit